MGRPKPWSGILLAFSFVELLERERETTMVYDSTPPLKYSRFGLGFIPVCPH